jgi:V8-like Glu-specific endopeptidase
MDAQWQAEKYVIRGDVGDDAVAFAARDRSAANAGRRVGDGAAHVMVDTLAADAIGGFHEYGFASGSVDDASPHAPVFDVASEAFIDGDGATAGDGIDDDVLNPAGQTQEKVLFGRDTRGFVSHANVRRFPYAAICLIRARFRDGWFTGTGVLATSQMVVTAAHNLIRSTRASQVELYFGAFHQQFMAKRTASRIEVHPRYRSSVDPPEVDYGAVFFSSALTEIDYVPLVRVTDSQTYKKIRNSVEIAGYPKINGSAGVMYSARNRIYDVLTSGRIEHQVDTTEGQSGAPIIAWFPQPSGSPLPGVVGIHNQADPTNRQMNYGVFVNQDMVNRLLAWKNQS